ncbi:hypothetical protein CDV36_016296 [Fusarium kuroshium]|uniref:Protein kinase domain-containing protein n=1 Tax=Fusarium kuroshium TaxID=2010991 RepID=A0A3M2QV16_9HYPO|nr:hypothetical protein CDV36_016296 [Fusarium kuroshium]
MARTVSPAREINFPHRPDPRPPIVYSDNNPYGCIEGDFYLILIDPDTILMLPSYDSQSDLVFGPVWSEEDLAWEARKTCVVYEDVFKASSPHPRIAEIIPTLPFHPTLEIHRNYIRTPKKVDLFCYGNTIYEMMTTFWPGDGTGLPFKEREDMYIRGEFPSLEDQYPGAVVHKCWNYQYGDVREVKEAIFRFLGENGFEVDDDVLRDLKPMGLFNGHMRESSPEEVGESTPDE